MGKVIAIANQKGGCGKTTTTVNLTTPLFLLRCVQLGISIRDLDLLTIGMVNDMYVESGNDQDADKNYSVLATQADFDRF